MFGRILCKLGIHKLSHIDSVDDNGEKTGCYFYICVRCHRLRFVLDRGWFSVFQKGTVSLAKVLEWKGLAMNG